MMPPVVKTRLAEQDEMRDPVARLQFALQCRYSKGVVTISVKTPIELLRMLTDLRR